MPSIRRGRRAVIALLATTGAALLLAAATAPAGARLAAVSAHQAADDPGWTVYHGDSLGDGTDTSGASFSPAAPAWTSPVLDGALYGEPLELDGSVYAATENDTVYALAADTGQVLWSTHVGTPVPSSDLPCGNIQPLVGITGTPVIDRTRGEIFAVADELVDGAPAHHLVGLDLATGNVMLDQPVDPPGAYPPAILQRTGLNLSDGNVVFGYGGNAGDCSTYHGWIVAVPESGGTPLTYDTTPDSGQGAVWLGGAAPEVDAAGNVWAASGNGESDDPSAYDGSDSVFELSPELNQEQLFVPADWYSDNDNDYDLGSSTPALLPDGLALQVGKSRTGYVLNQSDLGGIGGEEASAPLCSATVDGGHAVTGSIVYLPCVSGLLAVQVTSSPPGFNLLWTADNDVKGPPILAGGLLWSIGNAVLYALDPSTGAIVQQFPLGSEANDFPTPSVGDGLLLAPSAHQVLAFSGPAGIPAPPPSPAPPMPTYASYWMVASDGGVFTFGDAGFYGSAGNLTLNKPIVGMAATRDHLGYWLVASDGGVFNYGDAGFFGSLGNLTLNKPIVGMAATPDGGGYWLVASDGGVFAEGDAGFFGSLGNVVLNKPIVGMAATPDGGGYWLVASDGGVFAEGDAGFFGSLGNVVLNKPIVGMAATPDGGGYWLVASDGGVFTEGDAAFSGSAGTSALNAPVTGLAATPDGGGYWLGATDGGVFNYGDATFGGSQAGQGLNKPIVGLAAAG